MLLESAYGKVNNIRTQSCFQLTVISTTSQKIYWSQRGNRQMYVNLTVRTKRTGLPELKEFSPWDNWQLFMQMNSWIRPTLLKCIQEKMCLLRPINNPPCCHNKQEYIIYAMSCKVNATFMKKSVQRKHTFLSLVLPLLLARWTSITQNATSCNGLKQDIERGNSRALPSTCSGSSGPSTWAPSQAHGRLAITRNGIISKVNHQSRQHVPQYKKNK
jgi:hypothetical protein